MGIISKEDFESIADEIVLLYERARDLEEEREECREGFYMDSSLFGCIEDLYRYKELEGQLHEINKQINIRFSRLVEKGFPPNAVVRYGDYLIGIEGEMGSRTNIIKRSETRMDILDEE